MPEKCTSPNEKLSCVEAVSPWNAVVADSVWATGSPWLAGVHVWPPSFEAKIPLSHDSTKIFWPDDRSSGLAAKTGTNALNWRGAAFVRLHCWPLLVVR